MKRVFLLTGSNLGNHSGNLKSAADYLEQSGKIVKKSAVYRSEAWGYKSSQEFFNQCIEMETDLTAVSLLECILQIERDMGRIRTGKGYSDREIDIDILFFENEIINSEILIVPHPRLHLRRFALVPMDEICGSFFHPVLKRTISELLQLCPDNSVVVPEGWTQK